MDNERLIIDFWDVGQGDCSVIHLPDDELILIDVGPLGSPVVDWLANHPHLRIRSIILTHNDRDHAGALTSLVHCCTGRIGTLYVMADRNVKTPAFQHLYRAANAAYQKGGIAHIQRLEAPHTLWSSCTGCLRLDVKHPTMTANVLAKSANETSAVIVLSSAQGESVVWAGDTSMTNVAAVAANKNTVAMLGPHHGAPEDRKQPQFAEHLTKVSPGMVIASVGSHNQYGHPCVGFVRRVRKNGARFLCTQITKHCEQPKRLQHVFKGAAWLGLPQNSTGFSCRGPVRLAFNGHSFVSDTIANQKHKSALQNVSKPKCMPDAD